jgi:hypothetical protein
VPYQQRGAVSTEGMHVGTRSNQLFDRAAVALFNCHVQYRPTTLGLIFLAPSALDNGGGIRASL